jgi:fucose permease
MPRFSQRGTVHRTRIIIAINACMFVFGAVLLLMGSLLPSMKVSDAAAGSLGSFPLIGILAATILIGPILDKKGAKPVLAAGLALIVTALALMPTLASYAAMAAAALAYGLGGGILNTSSNALVSEMSTSGRSAALNVLGFSFSLGAISAPLLMTLFGDHTSIVLYALALASAVVLLAVLALRFPAPAQSATPLGGLLKVLNQPLVWLFGMLLFFESGNENCMFVWAGKLTGDLLHQTAQRADWALVAVSVALAAGRLSAVAWLKWTSGRTVILASAAVTITGALVVWSHVSFNGMVTGFAVIGLGMSAIFPTALGLAGDHFPRETGTVFGAAMAVALAGGVVGPLAGGLLARSSPARVLAVPLIAATGISALTLVVSGWSWRRTRTTAIQTDLRRP